MLDDLFTREWMDEFRSHSANMYQQLMHNFIRSAKPSFYRHVDDVESDSVFHDVPLPSNFGDFLLDKVEEQYNAEMARQSAVEEMEADQEVEVGVDADDLLHEFIQNRCLTLYHESEMVEMKETSNASYALSLHHQLWEKLFNIVVEPILQHLDRVLSTKALRRCKYLFLCGGFAANKYLEHRVRFQFGQRLQVLVPQHPGLCVVDGAARYGLRPNFVKVRRLAKSYGIQTNKSLLSLQSVKHLFPAHYIEDNTYFDDELQRRYVKQCFCIFATKNKAIGIEDGAIRKAVYKMTEDQKRMLIEIFESDKVRPMTTSHAEGSQQIGQLVIELPTSKEYKVWVEFKYSDTMLTVHAYPDGRRDLKREAVVQYH